MQTYSKMTQSKQFRLHRKHVHIVPKDNTHLNSSAVRVLSHKIKNTNFSEHISVIVQVTTS